MTERRRRHTPTRIEVTEKEFEAAIFSIVLDGLVQSGIELTVGNLIRFEREAKQRLGIVEGTSGKRTVMTEWHFVLGRANADVLGRKRNVGES